MFRRATRVLTAATAGLLCAPAMAQAQDECPNGWTPEAAVEFAPPVPAVDSGVPNVEGESGCTLLDDIWEPEPFSSHAAFVAHVAKVTRRYDPGERSEADQTMTDAFRGFA